MGLFEIGETLTDANANTNEPKICNMLESYNYLFYL